MYLKTLHTQATTSLRQKNIYGGTYNLLAHTLPEYGVTATFVDPFNYEEVENAIQENTKAIHVETLGTQTPMSLISRSWLHRPRT